MSQADIGGAVLDPGTLELVMRERAKALSAREWKFRLAGYGYAIKDVEGAQVVTSLSRGTELGVIPAHVL